MHIYNVFILPSLDLFVLFIMCRYLMRCILDTIMSEVSRIMFYVGLSAADVFTCLNALESIMFKLLIYLWWKHFTSKVSYLEGWSRGCFYWSSLKCFSEIRRCTNYYYEALLLHKGRGLTVPPIMLWGWQYRHVQWYFVAMGTAQVPAYFPLESVFPGQKVTVLPFGLVLVTRWNNL